MNSFLNLQRCAYWLVIIAVCLVSFASSAQDVKYFEFDDAKALSSAQKQNLEQVSSSQVLISQDWDEDTVYLINRESVLRQSLQNSSETVLVLSLIHISEPTRPY